MKLRALGRNLLIRLEFDLIDAVENKRKEESKIIMPQEVIDSLKGGFQIATVLSMGDSVFDDETPKEREMLQVGRKIVTQRYPGSGIDLDPYSPDKQFQQTRMINSSEVMLIVAEDDEEGADV